MLNRAVPVDNPEAVGFALRAIREHVGMTQRALAEALELSPAFVNDIEHGRRRLGDEHVPKLPPDIRGHVVGVLLAQNHVRKLWLQSLER